MIRACTKTYDIQSVRRSYENTGLLHRDFREALVDCGQWEKLDKEQKKFIASIVPMLQKILIYMDILVKVNGKV